MSTSLISLAVLAAAQAASSDVIIVTTDRGGERQDRAVTAVAVLDAPALELIGAHHPAEALNRLPGTQIQRGNGVEHLPAIRSPVLTGGAGAGSFLFLEDGIPLRAAGFGNVNGLFESTLSLAGGVEVFRGPGSALQGSNALHGGVNVLTPTPQSAPDYLELEAGSFGRWRAEARLGHTVGEAEAYLAAAYLHEDGWRDDAGLDRFDILLRADGQAGVWDWRYTMAFVDVDQETAGFIFGTDAYKDEDASRINSDPEAFRNLTSARAALRLDRAINQRDSITLTPYVRFGDMAFLMHFLPAEALEKSGHDSVGLQASWRRDWSGGHLILGSDLDFTTGYLTETQYVPTRFSFVQGEHYDYDVDAATGALYAQARQSLTPRVEVQAGARFEATRYEYDNHLANDTIGRYQRIADRDDQFELFTPHIGIFAEVSENASLYGRLARGARAPQTAELYRLQPNQVIDDIEPETLDSAELGYRHAFASGAFLDITGFAMRKENVFFRDADGFNVTDGKTEHSGVEFALFWPLAEAWSVDLAASWAEHVYAFNRNVGNASEIITDGNEIDTAPRWLGSASLNWDPTSAWRVQLDWRHVGAYFTNAANTAEYEGHDVFGLRARYDVSDNAEIFAAIRNLTDERYAERADFAFGNDRYFPGEPRALSLGVRLTR